MVVKKPMLIVVSLLVAMMVSCILGCGWFVDPTTTSSTTTIITTTTTTEPPASWRQAEPAAGLPSARCYQALVYDPTTRRVLMFGGFDGTNALAETWAYDPTGNAWTDLKPASEKQPTAAAQMPGSFDPATSKVITFDGTSWGYDVTANTWNALGPKGDKLKPARVGPCMALDVNSGMVILFGGTDRNKCYNETWSYDPAANTWTNLKPAGEVPTGRSDAGMVYEPNSGTMVLFGGVDGDFNCLEDTWSYDPASNVWTKITTAATPSARSGHGMAYDRHSKKIILFGGIDSQLTCYADTWVFDLAESAWTQSELVGASPMARGRCALVYADDIDKLILFGGATVQPDASGGFGTQVYLNDLWLYGVYLDADGAGGTTTESSPTPAVTSSTLAGVSTSSTLP